MKGSKTTYLKAEKRREEHIIAQTMNPENYIERERPNLFNIIKKLREDAVSRIKE